MPLPRLYLLHPSEHRLPGITSWLADVRLRMDCDAAWDGCDVIRIEYDGQAAFNVPTVSDQVLRAPGPVLLLQKVQQSLRGSMEGILRGRAIVYCRGIYSPDELWEAFQTARLSYEDGEPRIPLREVLAILIIRKLVANDCWGGGAKNKCFMWAHLLPKGGFPKELADHRDILNVAHMLTTYDILSLKKSQGMLKYALGEKAIVESILKAQSFDAIPKLRKFFEKRSQRVPGRLRDYKA